MNDITTARLLPGTAYEGYLSVRPMSSPGNPMTLKAQLDACRRTFEASTPPGVIAALQGSVAQLVQTGLVRQAVKAGERAPPFRLRSSTGDFVALSEALDRGPVVVNFFWGGWCRFCRLELGALADAQSEIERLGARLIGLSPLPDADGPSSFLILKDPGCRIAARYRIAFRVARQFRPGYLALGYPDWLKKGPNRWVLPLPAIYVVDRNGRVVLSYVDADYRTRLEPAEIIVALTHLRSRTKTEWAIHPGREHSGSA